MTSSIWRKSFNGLSTTRFFSPSPPSAPLVSWYTVKSTSFNMRHRQRRANVFNGLCKIPTRNILLKRIFINSLFLNACNCFFFCHFLCWDNIIFELIRLPITYLENDSNATIPNYFHHSVIRIRILFYSYSIISFSRGAYFVR